MRPRSTTWYIDGLCCSEEEQLIRKRLSAFSGILDVRCNVVARTVTVSHTGEEEPLAGALAEIGFAPRRRRERDEPSSWWERNGPAAETAAAAALLASGMVFGAVSPDAPAAVALLVLAIGAGGWRVARKALVALRLGSLDMNVLMVLATLGAMGIGKWEEGGAVMVLFALSHLLERYSMRRSRNAIRSLLRLSPDTASVRSARGEIETPVGDVAVGATILIRPGERIPLDGRVAAGSSSVNQAPITGESLPVSKRPGDEVYAGSLNERGSLDVAVTALHAETMLSRIIRTVEESESRRAPIQDLADRFARIYTPFVLGVALVIVTVPPLVLGEPFGVWFYRALVLLVIACPCALVISTPVTVMSAMTNAARRGILVKGGKAMQAIGSVRAIAFDKTGTLTRGVVRVTDVIPMGGTERSAVLRLAAALEERSEHPIGEAIVRSAREEGLRGGLDVSEFESMPGRGARGVVGGERCVIGSRDYFEELGLLTPEAEDALRGLDGRTPVLVGTSAALVGILAVADEARPESRAILEQLERSGVATVMLTGDAESSARSIARETAVGGYHAGVLPDAKAGRIAELKERYGTVAMVGDGINDAPSLAAATVGIAMGARGADVTIDTADIVLMSDDLGKIPELFRISKRTMSVIKQNIAIALVTKGVFLVLGVFGAATLWMGILADDGATLVVVLNGLRLLREE